MLNLNEVMVLPFEPDPFAVERYEDMLDMEFSVIVPWSASCDEIKGNDYNLNIPRYVDTFEQEEEISLSDIASELQEQDKEIKAAQDELLSQFAELTASDEQAQAEIAELMKTLEGLFWWKMEIMHRRSASKDSLMIGNSVGFQSIIWKLRKRTIWALEQIKSYRLLMGIFSLDLSKTLVLRIHSTDENVIADLTSKIQQFIVK